MRITIPDYSAPTCFCGGKMEIFVDVPSQRLCLKCVNCWLEQYEYVPFDTGTLTLRSVYHSAHSIME